MITHDDERCVRDAVVGGVGFCWQHAPAKINWEKIIERGTLAIATAEVIVKIAELGLKVLTEFFGSGDEGTIHKAEVQKVLGIGVMWPGGGNDADDIRPSSRVDWKELHGILVKAKSLSTFEPGEADVEAEQLAGRFDAWFASLSDFHKGQLLRAVGRYNESSSR